MLKKHKTFPDYDLALYVDGFLANEEAKFSEALGRFNKILAWFPNSRFVPDAHMVRAEFEFTKDFPDYQNAFNEYEKVLKYKETGLYDIALFKSVAKEAGRPLSELTVSVRSQVHIADKPLSDAERARPIAGDLSQVIADYTTFKRLGVQHLCLSPRTTRPDAAEYVRSMEFIAKHLRPALS